MSRASTCSVCRSGKCVVAAGVAAGERPLSGQPEEDLPQRSPCASDGNVDTRRDRQCELTAGHGCANVHRSKAERCVAFSAPIPAVTYAGIVTGSSSRLIKPRTLPKQHEPCGLRRSHAHCPAWMPALMSSTIAARAAESAPLISPTVCRKQ
jgi:hypothetical protein